MMSWNKRIIAAGMAAALLLSVTWAGPAAVESLQGTGVAKAAEETMKRTITVTGEGKITIQPDVAYVNVGVFSKAKTANEAQSMNAKSFAAVEKALLEQFDVDAKDIKTTGFHVQPEYTYPQNGGEPTITGYTADHNVTVTYRDMDGIGVMLDALSKAGANRVNGIQFGTEKGEAYELQAIEKAMANAEGKANAIASYAKQSVKGVLSVQQNGMGGGGPIVYPMAKTYAVAESATASSSVQPGEMEFTTTVTVTYEM